MGDNALLKNSIFLLSSAVIEKSFSFFILLILANRIEPAVFGKYSFVVSTTILFAIFSDFGLKTALLIRTAKEPDKVLLFTKISFLLKFAVSLLTCAVLFCASYCIGSPETLFFLVMVIGTSNIAETVNELFFSIYRAFEKMRYELFINSCLKMTELICCAVFVTAGNNLNLFILSVLFTRVSGIAVNAFIFKIYFIRKDKDNRGLLRLADIKTPDNAISAKGILKDIIILSLPYGFISIFREIYLRIDIALLYFLSGARNAVNVANYAIALNMSYVFLILAESVGNAILPRVSRHVEQKKPEQAKRAVADALYYTIGFCLPVPLFISFHSEWLITILFQDRYPFAHIALAIVVWMLPIRYINHALGVVLASREMQKKQMICAFICALFNVSGNLIAIPYFGIIGAGVMTVSTELLLFIMYSFFVSRHVRPSDILNGVKLPFLLSIPLFVLLALNYNTIHNVYISLLSLVIYYATFVVLIRPAVFIRKIK